MIRPNVPSVAPPPKGETRYKLTISYDGTTFHGFAKNRGVETVEGLLIQALQNIIQALKNIVINIKHEKDSILNFLNNDIDSKLIKYRLIVRESPDRKNLDEYIDFNVLNQ